MSLQIILFLHVCMCARVDSYMQIYIKRERKRERGERGERGDRERERECGPYEFPREREQFVRVQGQRLERGKSLERQSTQAIDRIPENSRLGNLGVSFQVEGAAVNSLVYNQWLNFKMYIPTEVQNFQLG